MANNVNVNITARDLTQAQLTRMRRNFAALGQDLGEAIGARTRQNFDRLSSSINQSRRDLTALRGSIPDAEFLRLDDAIRRAQTRMRRGFSNVGDQAFQRIIEDVREVEEGFRDLDRSAQIRVRIDDSALRRADQQLAAGLRDRDRQLQVDVAPNTRNFWPRARRALASPLRSLSALVSETMRGGLMQGIAGAFGAAGPFVKLALASAIMGALSFVGAALSGLLVTALGLAFVSIGAISAATSEEVKRNWEGALETLKDLFKSVGEPLIPVVHEAIHQLEKFAEKIAPVFRDAMAGAAPAFEDFIDFMFKGMERFGKNAFQPIMDAFEVFGPVFGDAFSDAMDMWGESFADMAKLVREHSGEIDLAIRGVFLIIDKIIDTITFFGKAWVQVVAIVGDSTGLMLKGFEFFFDFIGDGLSNLLGHFINIAASIPGVDEGPLKRAKENFDTWRSGVSKNMKGASEDAFAFDEQLEELNRVRVLKADIKSWRSKLETARADLKKTTDQKARAKLTATIKDLQAKVRKAEGELNRIDGKRATATITTNYVTNYKTTGSMIPRGPTGAPLMLARGGVVRAAATGGVRSNMTLVGEQGPELVSLAPGSRVRSNPDTRRALRNGGGGGGSTLVIKSSGRRVDDMLLEMLREAIHQRGGDPVVVLGG